MFSKWGIKGIDNYVFGEDKNLYRLPFTDGLRSYGVRKIKMQYPSRWKINGEWLSKSQMYDKLYLLKAPKKLFEEKSDLPF